MGNKNKEWKGGLILNVCVYKIGNDFFQRPHDYIKHGFKHVTLT